MCSQITVVKRLIYVYDELLSNDHRYRYLTFALNNKSIEFDFDYLVKYSKLIIGKNLICFVVNEWEFDRVYLECNERVIEC